MGKTIRNIVIGFAVFIGLVTVLTSLYVVHRNETALIVHLGRVSGVQTEPGLYLHAPFIENTVSIYTGKRLYDIPTSDVITSDKKSMIADDYIIWSVTDPVKYYQSLGAVRGRAEERLEAAVYNATKNIISSMTQDEIVAARGNTLTHMITEKSNSDTAQYGLQVMLSEIKALDLPDANKQAVYDRMISERNNIAAGYTAKGNAEAQKIRNDTNKQVAIKTAEAEKEAAKIEAEGEARYMQILSDAYNNEEKAEFYNYLRSLDSLKAMEGKDKTIILDKSSELARILYGVGN